MTSEQVSELVKNLEPLFLGYKAEGNRLINENGMEIIFSIDWKNKSTVRGLHASRCHSIGCSFNKPVEKIFKDIRRRLMPDYHADFFETKKARIEKANTEEEQAQKLEALASVIGGEICSDYGYSRSSTNKYVKTENSSIYQDYYGKYEFKIVLSYFDSMKMAKYLREFFPDQPLE